MPTPLIVMALEQEAQGQFAGLPVMFTGVGKVNAAYQLAKAIAMHNPSHIYNLGSAGSTVFMAGTLVHCTEFVQRDMDVTPLGFARYQTPFDVGDSASKLVYGKQYAHLPAGICGTGDSFHTDGAVEDFNVMDMEAYALAKICQAESIPFSCIKFITDGADGQAATDWGNALQQAAMGLRAAFDQLHQH